MSNLLNMAVKESHIRVPEGYFADLKVRLGRIPAEHPLQVKPLPAVQVTLWQRVRPYVALAACFAISVAAGTLLLERTAASPSESLYDYLASADMIPVTDPFAIVEKTELSASGELSSGEIIDYLIECGTSIDEVADACSDNK